MMLEFFESYGIPHSIGNEYEVNLVWSEKGDIYELRELNILLSQAVSTYADQEQRELLTFFNDDEDDEGWIKLKKLKQKFKFMSKDKMKIFILKNLLLAERYGYLKIRCENDKFFWRVDEKCTDINIYLHRKFLL